MALAQALQHLDNRDEGAQERMHLLSDHEGIWGCHSHQPLPKVCTREHVNAARAIQHYSSMFAGVVSSPSSCRMERAMKSYTKCMGAEFSPRPPLGSCKHIVLEVHPARVDKFLSFPGSSCSSCCSSTRSPG